MAGEQWGHTLESMLRSLQLQMEEHVDPGVPVTVYLYGLDKEVTQADAARLQAFMTDRGIASRVRFGAYGEHANALELTMGRPSRSVHPNDIPFVLVMIGGLALIGILAFAGFSIVKAVSDNIVPIIVVGAVVFIFVAMKGRFQFGPVTVGKE